MTSTFASNFDALSGWRSTLSRRLADLAHYLGEHELADGPIEDALSTLMQRLASEKLVVAFVAEFSRGKSELINAIFFADAGKRVLPATPGRTTMCPVELAYDAEEPPTLSLLPIETRLEGLSLGELRTQPRAWTRVPLNVKQPDELSEALTQVMRTRWVAQDEARPWSCSTRRGSMPSVPSRSSRSACCRRRTPPSSSSAPIPGSRSRTWRSGATTSTPTTWRASSS
jgi:hypothetical protein